MDGTVYRSSLFISYEDSEGNLYPFDYDREIPIDLKTTPSNSLDSDVNGEKPDDDTSNKETDGKTDITIKQADSNNNQYFLALLILGIFILVSTVIFSLVHFKVGIKNKQKGEKELDISGSPCK